MKKECSEYERNMFIGKKEKKNQSMWMAVSSPTGKTHYIRKFKC